MTDSAAPTPGDFYAPSPEELQELFPQLEILELIACGGMGAVYKARQPQLDRIVALKILPPAVAQDPEDAERFRREARAMAQLNHPNVVSIFDFGEAGSFFYFLMEHVDGYTLHELIQAGGLEEKKTLALFAQICQGLSYAHSKGVIHLDIKPGNVMLDKEGRAKLLDFGLASLAIAGRDEVDAAEEDMGTPDYAAPERFSRDLPVDHRADVFSLGVMLYEMLTSQIPRGDDYAPASKLASTSPPIDNLISRCLAKDLDERFGNVDEVSAELATCRQNLSQPGKSPSSSVSAKRKQVSEEGAARVAEIEKKGNKGGIGVLVGLLALAAIGGGAWFVLKDKFTVDITVPNRDGGATPTDPVPPATTDPVAINDNGEGDGANGETSSPPDTGTNTDPTPTDRRAQIGEDLVKLREAIDSGEPLKSEDYNVLKIFNGHAYARILKQENFRRASAVAKLMQGHLVTIGDPEEDTFIREQFASDENEILGRRGFFIGAKYDGSAWLWENEEPMAYSKFGNVGDASKRSVATHEGGYWGMAPGGKPRSFIIEWSPDSSTDGTSTTTTSDTTVPDEPIVASETEALTAIRSKLTSYCEAEIDPDFDQGVADLLEKYLGALDRIEEKTAATGDLSAVLVVREEAERVGREMTAPKTPSTNSDIARLQEVFATEMSKLEGLRDRKLSVAHSAAGNAALELRETYTTAGNSSAAAGVDAFLSELEHFEAPDSGTPPVSSANLAKVKLTRLHTLTGHSGRVTSVAISPKSPLLVSGGSDGKIKIWQSRTGVLLQTLSSSGPVEAVTLSPDAKTFAVSCESGTIEVWSMESRKRVRHFEGGGSNISDLVYAKDGRHLYALTQIGEQCEICYWDIANSKILDRYPTGFKNANTIALSTDGTKVLVGSQSGGAKLLSTESGNVVWTNPEARGAACFSPEQDLVFVAGQMLSASSGSGEEAKFRRFNKISNRATALESNVFVMAMGNGDLVFWDGQESSEIKQVSAHQRGCAWVTTAGSQRIISSGADSNIAIWSVSIERP